MGSFSGTCAISGLPISCGDAVRFCLLQSSPYGRQGESWYLRAPPIRAQYNDYGSIEKVNPKDEPICRLWLDGLKQDVIEKGVGDNCYRDVPVRVDMTFDQLLSALSENRVEVRRELDPHKYDESNKKWNKLFGRAKIAKGVPTIKRVEKVIADLEPLRLAISILDDYSEIFYSRTRAQDVPCNISSIRDTVENGKYFQQQFKPFITEEYTNDSIVYRIKFTSGSHQVGELIVDQLRRGEIRVRCAGYVHGKLAEIMLTPLKRKLNKRYACMITCGQINEGPNLIIRPKVGTKEPCGKDMHDFHFGEHFAGEKSGPETLSVTSVMIREDVWQIILKYNTEYFIENKFVKIDTNQMKEYVKQAYESYCAKDKKSHHAWYYDNENNPVVWFVSKNPSITGFGMDTSWELICQSPTTKVAKQYPVVLDAIAEALVVCDAMAMLRIPWSPANYYCGPQFGEWNRHKLFYQQLINICTKEIKNRSW